MFDNIGEKIKGVAKFFCYLGIIAYSVLAVALVIIDEYMIGASILILIFGPISAWLGSILIYGFGQLISNTDIIADLYYDQYEEKRNKEYEKMEQEVNNKIKQAKENMINQNFNPEQYIDILCPHCRSELSFTKNELTNNQFLLCPLCNNEFSTNMF